MDAMTRLREIAAGTRKPQTATKAIATARAGHPLPSFRPLTLQERAHLMRAALEVLARRAGQ